MPDQTMKADVPVSAKTASPWIRIIAGILATTAIAAGLWLAVTQPWKEPAPVTSERLAANLELAAGEVLLEVEGQEGSQRLLSRTPLPEGAIVSTGTGARALIRLSDGSRVFLHEDTKVRIGAGVILDHGRAWLDAPPLERGQEPSVHQLGASSVTLADGGASLENRDGAASVYVAEGLAILTSPGGRSEVKAGERASVDGDAAPELEAVAFWDDWTGGMGDRSGLARSSAVGSGSLYAVDRQAAPGTPSLPLSIQRQTVKVVVRDNVAETMVDQQFFNPTGRDVEGFYWFTIPEGSQLVSFALETDGRLVEGEIVERQEAAAKYEQAVQRRNDPALLEWIDERTVRARVFPVPALGQRRTVVRYQQLLTEAEGKLRYSYPLAGPPGKDAPTIEEFALQVELGDLAQRYELSTLGEARVEAEGQRVTMRRSGYTPRADFELELTRKSDEDLDPLRVNIVEPGGDQARFMLVRYTPDLDFTQGEAPRGDVVVVVDTSAAGDVAEHQTKLAVAEALLRSLSKGDRFAVMSADVTATVLYPDDGLADADPEAISGALERLAQHSTGGATDLGAIFEKALERVHGLEQPAVIYVGDGLATSGERAGDVLAERLRRSMTGSRARLFTVGVGQEVDAGLLTRLARVGGGASTRVEVAEQAVVRALELSGALKTPTLTDLEIELGEGLDDVFMNATGKLSRGQELVVLARTHHDLPKEITVRGRLAGEDIEKTYEVKRERSVLDQIVPRLWAGAYIERLMGDSRGPEAVRGKVLSLGLEYGLMSPFTSFLALESEAAYAQMGVQRRSRRFGGVRLTADASQLQPEQSVRGAGVLQGVIAALTAPLGCGMADRGAAREDAIEAEPPVASPAPAQSGRMAKMDKKADMADDRSANRPRRGPPAANAEKSMAGEVAEPEPAMMPEEEAPVDMPAALSADENFQRSGGGLGGLDKDGAGGDEGDAVGSRVTERKKGKAKIAKGGKREEYRRPAEKPAPRVSRIHSPVARGIEKPCSDASSRGLVYRRILWRKRLKGKDNMVAALEVFEASAGSCEISGWKDQRVFLQLLQQRAATEHDVGLLLAHFRGEPDAQQYLARALLRRLVEPTMIAAVENALFGAAVDWNEVDRRLAIQLKADAKLEILQEALARAPGDPEGERRMITYLVEQNKLEEAVARGRRLREQGLMTPVLAQQLGEILVSRNTEDEARRLFSEIVEFDPHNPASRRLLGDIFLRHRWYDAAYRQYQDLVGLVPEDATASIRVARAAAGAGRVDEGLRVLRKVAAGEGRPGVNDPRRWARLHAAGYLGGLLANPKGDAPAESVARELKRLQLFDAPATWTLLLWEDLEARLVLSAGEDGAQLLGDGVDAGVTGLQAVQLPPGGGPELAVRHTGAVLKRGVRYVTITIAWDGKAFDVQTNEGTIAAGTVSEALAAAPSDNAAG